MYVLKFVEEGLILDTMDAMMEMSLQEMDAALFALLR